MANPFPYSDKFIDRYMRTDGNSPILFFHFMCDDSMERVENQGYIYQLYEDGTGRGVYFSFLSGEETDDFLFTRAWLTSNRILFYFTDADMNNNYLKLERAWRARNEPVKERSFEQDVIFMKDIV